MGNEGLCWRCGEIEPHGMDCGCLSEPCFGLHPDHIADATKMVQPAPLHESEDVMEALSVVAATGLSGTAEGLRLYISDLTRRLAEAEKSAWEECHAMSSRLSKANQESNMWRNCAVYLDYRGADYCVAIHKELDGLQEDNRKHREQVSKLLAEWKRRAESAEARVRELEAQISASKQNERRWIAKGEEAIAERNAANAALEAIKKHQEIVAGTGAAQMSTTWKIADAHLRSIGSLRAAIAATEVPA